MSAIKASRTAAGILAGLATTAAFGAQVMAVQAARQDNHFRIGMQIVLTAPAPAAFAALRDYAAMRRYDPEIRSIRIETTSDADRVRLFLTIHTCVLFFCKTIQQEQLMTARPEGSGGTLQADFLPAAGAFQGRGTWLVQPCAANSARTCLTVHIELEPLFWVPPVIGPWLVRKKMQEEAGQISRGLEQTILEAH